MVVVPISIENKQDVSKENELFEIGVPFPIGQVTATQKLALVNQVDERAVPFSYRVSAKWPDGSVKWVWLVFRFSLAPGDSAVLALKFSLTEAADNCTALTIEKPDEGHLLVNTGTAQFRINQSDFAPFSNVKLNSFEIPALDSSLELRSDADECGEKSRAVVSCFQEGEELIAVGASSKSLRFEGEFQQQGRSTGFRFISTLQFFSDCSLLKWEFTLWNSQAAEHPGGCWDLGDAGSMHFNALSLNLNTDNNVEQLWKDAPSADWHAVAGRARLLQTGSGCEAGGAEFFNGYQLKTEDGLRAEGKRVSPLLFIRDSENSERQGIAICVEKFWQNFPKGFELGSNSLKLSLFPDLGDDHYYELQAGERKTHTVYFDFGASTDALAWVNQPSSCRLPSEWYAQCQVLPFLTDNEINDPLSPFVQQGIDGENSFVAKREIIDEYGWRNFGDVYADHETLYQQPGEAPLVSHYNNQYDAIYGYARQFMQTGDSRWFKLMDELALHVTDIDIYHTDQDRVEYNNGLFWHTDHYLDAHTCTHRTFSKHNTTSSTPGQTGGGPGSEHCYTSGLMYHYYLTGSKRSKDAVLELAEWMIISQNGAKSFLAQILSAKNHELGKLIRKLKGQQCLPYRYPFTRGTGNYVVALLDAYSLSGERVYLQYAERVIKQTVHPADDISLRNLQDIEVTWSYVVFLQALAKYLHVKEELNELDYAYKYAKAALLHYAEWMLHNESPYLDKVEILEFPNDTWVAQEIRKLCIFIYAANYDQNLREQYCVRATEFLNYIVSMLAKSKESHYSRIQILLLQSYGPHLWCGVDRMFDDRFADVTMPDFGSAPRTNVFRLIFTILKKLIKGLSYFSIKGERAWLKTRT